MIDQEIWKDIDSLEGYYQVSNYGRIRSLDRYTKHSEGHLRLSKGKILKPRINHKRNGYLEVGLKKDGIEFRRKIHRLVAEAFLPNPECKPQVNHIDGDKSNNCVSNLEWVTDLENKQHAWKTGLSTADHRKNSIICNETGKVYESVQKASELIPCDRRYLFRHLKGEVKRVKGLTYRYVD